MVRLLAFDLDGTLTQHKTALEACNRAILDELRKYYCLLMVGAGQCERIFRQMGDYPIDIIGNYGLQESRYDAKTRRQVMLRDTSVRCDRESVARRIEELRKRFGYTEYTGEGVEFHPSGCVTFPLCGTKAAAEVKLSFDPTRAKRRAIYDDVCRAFPEFEVFVGGASSFDMAPVPYNKYNALDRYCQEHGYRHDEVVFLGDDYGQGGNDESVYQSDFGFIFVDDYRRLGEAVKPLLPTVRLEA